MAIGSMFADPAAPASTSGMVAPQLGSMFASPAAPASSADSGPSIFGWHPHLPNLGGIAVAKQLASGILGLAELPKRAYDISARADNGGPLEALKEIGGGFAKGIGSSVENVAATAGSVIGVPFTHYNLGDEVLAPALQAVNEHLGNTVTDPVTGETTGYKPQSLYEEMKHEGAIRGIVNQVGTVAMIAAPIAGQLTGAAGAASAASEAASAAGDASKAAELAERATTLANRAETVDKFAHPYKAIADAVGNLGAAAHDAVYSPLADEASPARLQQARDAVTSQMQAPAAPAAQNATADATHAIDRQAAQAKNQELLTPFGAEPTVPLFRGEPEYTRYAARGTMFHESPDYAKNFASGGGNVWSVRVPQVLLDTWKAAEPDVGYDIPPEWADAAREMPSLAPKEVEKLKVPAEPGLRQTTKEGNEIRTNVVPQEGARASYGAGAQDDALSQMHAAEARAAAAIEPTAAETRVGAKLLASPAPWAQRVVAHLPDAVNRGLSGSIYNITQGSRLRNVSRSFEQMIEVAQRSTRDSEFVRGAVTAGKDILKAVPDLTAADASRMVGEELTLRMNGGALADQAIRDGHNPVLADALRSVARRGLDGISSDVLAKLNPAQRTALEEALTTAVEGWKTAKAAQLQTLLASRKGAQGLETQLLDQDMGMTKAQGKMYASAMKELSAAADMRSKGVVREEMQREADANRSKLVADKRADESRAAMRAVGPAQRTVESLRTPMPIGILHIDNTVNDIMQRFLDNGAVTYDVGKGEAAAVHTGFSVSLKTLLNTADTHLTPDIVRHLLIDNMNELAGADTRLNIHATADGHIAADISIGSWGGKPLDQWAATVLGKAFKQETVWDAEVGDALPLPQDRVGQDLAANYIQQALNNHSPLARFAQRLQVASQFIPSLTPTAIDDAVQHFMAMDYAVAGGDSSKLGEYFGGLLKAYPASTKNGSTFVNDMRHYMDADEPAPFALQVFDRLSKGAGKSDTAIRRPASLVNPSDMQRVKAPGGTELTRYRWETDAAFGQRARQYGEARVRAEGAALRADLASKVAARADTAARHMFGLMNEPTRTELLAAKLEGHASETLGKLATQLENPTTRQVAAEWQPMWDAFKELHQHATEDLTGATAEMIEEIPGTFSDMLRYAADRGFEPTHLPDLTWARGQKLLFNQMRLGKAGRIEEVAAGTRKVRTGSLAAVDLADKSIETLAGSLVDATHELYSNKLIDFIENYYARTLPADSALPEGWKLWAPDKHFLLTGSRPSGDAVAAGTQYMVPESVSKALANMSEEYNHWAFRAITKVTKPWRTVMLTMSPAWYLKHFIGNAVMAQAEGVRLGDWAESFKQWRTKELPEAVRGLNYQATIAEDGSYARTLLGRSIKDTVQSEGVKSAVIGVRDRLNHLNQAWDSISRGAVYEKTLRTTGSRAAAIERSYTALMDYGNLTPFERSAVRAVVPFYAYQKGTLKLLMRFPADHPLATGVLLQLGKMHEEYMQDLIGGPIPDAYDSAMRFGNHLVSGRLLDPWMAGVSLLSPQGITDSFNPYLDLFMRTGYENPNSLKGALPAVTPTGAPAHIPNALTTISDMFASAPLAGLAGDTSTSQLGRTLHAQTYTPQQVQRVIQNLQNTSSAQQRVGVAKVPKLSKGVGSMFAAPKSTLTKAGKPRKGAKLNLFGEVSSKATTAKMHRALFGRRTFSSAVRAPRKPHV